MDKRSLTIIAVAFLLLGAYPMLLETFYPEYGKKVRVARSARASSSAAGGDSAVPATMPASVLRADDFQTKDDVSMRTSALRLVFNQQLGAIRQIAFNKYMNSETKMPIEFISLKDSKGAPAAINFILPADAPQPLYETPRAPSDGELTFATSVGSKLAVTKEYRFDPTGYTGKLVLTFQNKSDGPLDLQYELFVGSRIQPRHSIDAQYIEADFFQIKDGKKTLRHITENRLGKEVTSGGPVRWVAVKDRHFSIIFKPSEENAFSGLVRGLGDQFFSASLISPKTTLAAAGGTCRQEFSFYIGPNDIDVLEGTGMTDIINFGKMDPIARLLLGGLDLLHKGLRNYGVAVIALTLILNVLLFPFTRASFISMKRMQEVQPQMAKLREQHKKNPEKLNKEMMELYRKHKVNPFGGCLPMLLQMPFFIALYVALSKTSALINANFLWVTDLSSPDRVRLPVSLPFLGQEIHVLPLIMVGAMAVQQRFTQVKMEGQDPAMQQQQKMMAVMMPIIFGFIFYSMPSGLVLYWLTNTILMSLFQLSLKKSSVS